MSVWIPRLRLRDGWTLDPLDFAYLFNDLLMELNGQLGEHNWKEATFSVAELAVDAAFTVKFSSTLVSSTCDMGSSTGAVIIDANGVWQTVSTVSSENYTEATMLWILGNVQHFVPSTIQLSNGSWYALRINGHVIAETITGSAEFGVEGLSEDNGLCNPAIMMPGMPVTVEIFYPVPAGEYTVELVAMRHPVIAPDWAPADNPNYFKGATLIVIEVAR